MRADLQQPAAAAAAGVTGRLPAAASAAVVVPAAAASVGVLRACVRDLLVRGNAAAGAVPVAGAGGGGSRSDHRVRVGGGPAGHSNPSKRISNELT